MNNKQQEKKKGKRLGTAFGLTNLHKAHNSEAAPKLLKEIVSELSMNHFIGIIGSEMTVNKT